MIFGKIWRISDKVNIVEYIGKRNGHRGIDPSRSLKVLLNTKIMIKSSMVTALEDFFRAPL